MEYAPLLLEVVHPSLVDQYGCKYLLQIWNQDGDKTYEKRLQGKPRTWAISYDYLLYIPSTKDEHFNCLFIVELEDQKNHVTLIDNFIENLEEVLLAATQYELKHVHLSPEQVDTPEDTILTMDSDEIKTTKFQVRIQGLLQNNQTQYILFETSDNQLDFSILEVNNEDGSYKFKQAQEIVPRKVFNDPIVKTDHFFSSGTIYSLGLRKSGAFDIYWNMMLTDTPENVAKDIAMNQNAYYIQIKNTDDQKLDGDIYMIKTSLNQGDFSYAKEIPKETFYFNEIFISKVRHTVKIAHSHFVSTYDLVKQEWMNHTQYDDDIFCLFRTNRLIKNKWKKSTAAILQNEEIHFVDDYDQEQTEPIKIEGDIVRIGKETQVNDFLYLIVQVGDEYKLKVFYKEKVYDIEYEGLNKDSQITCLKNNQKQPVILIQNEKTKIGIYQLQQTKTNTLKGRMQRLMTTITTKTFSEAEKQDEILDNPIQETDDFGNLLEDYEEASYEFSLEVISEFENADKSIKYLDWIECGCYLDCQQYVFLFGWEDLFLVDMQKQKFKKFEDQNVIGITFFSKRIYGLCQDSKVGNLPPGIRLYDLQRIQDTQQCKATPVKTLDVGAQNDLVFNADIERVGFIESLTDLVLTPLLHRNSIRFFGMSKQKDYIAYKILSDKLVTLSKHNEVQLWDLVSAKMVDTYRLDSQDFSGYEVFSYSKQDKVLLKSKLIEEDIQESGFYQDWQVQTTIQNQVPFSLAENKTIRKWKIIEIVNERQVKEHHSFFHPLYEDQKDEQKFYFSEDCKYMIERLKNYRVLLYQAEEDTSELTVSTRWKLVRKIENYPQELEIDPNFLTFFSPDFSLSVDIDKDAQQFFIKDNFSNQLINYIPKYLMDYDPSQGKQQIMRRFQFVDQNTFKLLMKEGVEKLIDFNKGFVEIEHNTVPLLEQSQLENGFYYEQPEQIDLANTFKRLQRKYQSFKSNYYLLGKKDPTSMNRNMFSVDPHKFDHIYLSFSFLYWNIIEQIDEENIVFQDLDDNIIEALLFNILPGNRTVLHYIHDQEEYVKQLLKLSHPLVNNEPQIKFYMPIIPNYRGGTVIHKLLNKNSNSIVNQFLKVLKLYPLDHHSRETKDCLPKYIDRYLGDLYPYLKSRRLQTQQLRNINKAMIGEDYKQVVDQELQFSDEKFLERLNIGGEEVEYEVNVKCEIIDIPSIYHFKDPDFQTLFDTLAKYDEYDLFEQKPIQKIIEFNYPLVKEWTVKKLFYPFILYLILFVFYSDYVYFHKNDGTGFAFLNFTTLVTLFLLSTYFLVNEFSQLMQDPLDYFGSIWNYIDVIPIIGIYLIIPMNFFKFGNELVQAELEATVLAITSFFVWLKFLYFLRLFPNTSYLIHMIIQVISDMRYFLLILFITVIAFADSLLSISLANQSNDDQFVSGFFNSLEVTYIMILGEFELIEDVGQVSTWLVWTLFIFATVLDLIVLLNLLIAIISESFAKINSNSEMASFQVQSALIAENNYLVPDEVKEDYALKNAYLIMITDLDSQKLVSNDEIEQKIKDLNKLVQKQYEIISDMQKKQNQSDKKLNKIEQIKNKTDLMMQKIEGLNQKLGVEGE